MALEPNSSSNTIVGDDFRSTPEPVPCKSSTSSTAKVNPAATTSDGQPGNGDARRTVARGGPDEVNAAAVAAKAAFRRGPGDPPPSGQSCVASWRPHREACTRDCTNRTGTAGRDCANRQSSWCRAADNFYYFAEMCTRVDGHTYRRHAPELHAVPSGGRLRLISPWNVPFMTATWKVAPCLAFGNTAVLKMSELSPMTAARLGELALEAGIPPGVLNVVHGARRQEVGEPLVAHPDVRAISFTGSTVTGNRIMQAGGAQEVQHGAGRQEPVRDLRRRRHGALDAAVFMIFSNNGERCTAGRILVQ